MSTAERTSMRAGALEGVRVLDLGRMMAGPYCGRTLASMGAEVIKVENDARYDSARMVSPLVEGHKGRDGGIFFNIFNVNKKSILLDLTQTAGRELFLDLVRISDVVLENFAPRVMQKLGLQYEALRAARPDIILASLSGFGATGPERDYVSYASVVEAAAGITALNGFEDGPPYSAGPPFGDFYSGATGVFAIMAALVHRERTGRGQWIDVSQHESTITMFPEPVLEWEISGRTLVRTGNVRPGHAPSGVYRCLGQDRWISIQIRTDEEWLALCQVLGQEGIAADPRFSTFLSRLRNKEELDAWLDGKAAHWRPEDLFHALQGRGILAGISATLRDLLDDRHLRERGLFCEIDHPVSGKAATTHPPFRLSETPSRIERAGPLMGEHTGEVVSGLLGRSPEQVHALEQSRVLA